MSDSTCLTAISTSRTLPCNTSTPEGATTMFTPLAPVYMPLARVCMLVGIGGVSISNGKEVEVEEEEEEEEEEEGKGAV